LTRNIKAKARLTVSRNPNTVISRHCHVILPIIMARYDYGEMAGNFEYSIVFEKVANEGLIPYSYAIDF
jgi:hypothetical protein